MATKAMHSSLMPNMPPKSENISVMQTSMMLFIPIALNMACFSSFCAFARNAIMPVSRALVEFVIHIAPPTMRMKTIIPACFSKPLYMAARTCQVCGTCSVALYSGCPSAPCTYSPPGMSHVAIAHRSMTADTMMYVFGNFLFICPVISFCCPVFVLLRFSELQI